jgi:hypothetical protein
MVMEELGAPQRQVPRKLAETMSPQVVDGVDCLGKSVTQQCVSGKFARTSPQLPVLAARSMFARIF